MQCRPDGVCVRCGAARLAFVFSCVGAERPMDAVDLGVRGLTISSFGQGSCPRLSLSQGSKRHGRSFRVRGIAQSQACQPQEAQGWRAAALPRGCSPRGVPQDASRRAASTVGPAPSIGISHSVAW